MALSTWWMPEFLLFIALELVTVPFSNVLLRYRVNYQQNNAQLLGVLSDQLLGIPNFYKTAQRITNFEGIAGLYKGLCARLVELFMFALTFKLAFGFHPAISPFMLLDSFPDFTIQQCLIYYGLTVIISVPMKVFITRSTTTRYRLSEVDPSHAFQFLLSPTERKENLILSLYQIPGLFTCISLQTLFSFVSLATIHRLIRFYLAYGRPKPIRIGGRVVYIVLFLLTRAVLVTPFEVVACRLAAAGQTDNDNMSAMDMSDLESKESSESVPTFSSENVIQLREAVMSDSYAGFSDCVTKIRREEGLGALFRGWLGSVVAVVCI